ncbi:NAD(P)-binding protein [Penicillium malachiteum]|nr:NAD(P)-binding protein [Penicillium malachiteum]
MCEYAEITSIAMFTSFSNTTEPNRSTNTMSFLSKVAVAGASGNLGLSIVNQLIKNGFEVTILTRDSSQKFPPGIRVCRVDYNSSESLVSALSGQSAVVSALPRHALDIQALLIDAAVIAGVQRFIPSEFGPDTSNFNCALLPPFQGKILAQEKLKEKARSGELSYTIICTGPFLDWGLQHGFMNIKEKRTMLYNNGDQLFSTTTLQSVGRAVCGVLMNPAPTKNRLIRVHDVTTTQRKLLSIAREVTGPYGWTFNTHSIEEMLENSFSAHWQGMQDSESNAGFIAAAYWGKEYGGVFEQTENEMLGIPKMSDDVLRGLIHQVWNQ